MNFNYILNSIIVHPRSIAARRESWPKYYLFTYNPCVDETSYVALMNWGEIKPTTEDLEAHDWEIIE